MRIGALTSASVGWASPGRRASGDHTLCERRLAPAGDRRSDERNAPRERSEQSNTAFREERRRHQLPGAPREQRTNSIGLMIRIETIRGSLARRGFVDAVAAERVIEHWADEHEPLLDLLAKSADPDLALLGLDRLSERVPDLLARLTAAPVLARQLSHGPGRQQQAEPSSDRSSGTS